MAAPNIRSFTRVIPMIYAYTHPDFPPHRGWTKIGYTERQSVNDRIKQQHHTADIPWKLLWADNAMYKDGSGQYFTDHDFHAYLETEVRAERKQGTEWFHLDGETSEKYFNRFARRQSAEPENERMTYALRREQDEAVSKTKAYFDKGGTQFLWNAKPRFGKTLSTYDLIVRMGFQKVLIVTNRPSIANSWAEDFNKFIGWRGELCFVSDTDSLRGKPGVLSREDYVQSLFKPGKECGMVAFESLQGLKGSVYFGGHFDKLKWIRDTEFDLLVVDESQEGVDTIKTERAFDNIARRHTLYLSGTPFKQLASEQFAADEIYNWSYADEQEAKNNWDGEDSNPYETLPKLEMYTYQLSPMIRETIEKGLDFADEGGTVDYTFDLNEFFQTNEAGKFVHEAEIRKFLHSLSTSEKYPFSTPELRAELKHTMWFLNRVQSARALAKLLAEDPVFGDYEVILAAGDGKLNPEDEAKKAFDRVKKAIASYEKTITLTVGQLTVGITIPEWSGVLMLCNMQSPSSYMQAAFRAQNPCVLTSGGKRYRKETAYVFDFDPARTLIIFDEFANNLISRTASGRGTQDERKENIMRLLNFFPVLGEDDDGKMVELDAAQVLSIPRKLKSAEVVRHGFMSNFLFSNIANVFGAPAAVRDILERLTPAQEEKIKHDASRLDGMRDIHVDENGEVEISNEIIIGRTRDLFGDKLYAPAPESVTSAMEEVINSGAANDVGSKIQDVGKALAEHFKSELQPAAAEYNVRKSAQNSIDRDIKETVNQKFDKIRGDYEQKANIAKADFERKRYEAETEAEIKEASQAYEEMLNCFISEASSAMQEAFEELKSDVPQRVVERLEKSKTMEEKAAIEDEVRSHLRGFSRSIPSFIMAYGDGDLRLDNFDKYTEPDVFLEVTGITLENFRFLRDGGDIKNKETGETEHFDGHLFNEVVFNDAVQEFLAKRRELADYFDESKTEDIFDYIPPQKTNQIFTPKRIVKMMVDKLEEENPGCFDDPTKTFADLYMKSGLYITEVVKRLYRSGGLKVAFPDDKERIRHILKKQVYGMAPTRIIYLIATNYILGFDEELKKEQHNFVQADAAEAAKNGKLKRLVKKHFG